MKKKDILFLCQFFHPEYVSSAQLPFDTACALHDAGFSVGVLCGYPREYLDGDQIPRCETIQGIHVRRLKYIQMDRSGFLGRIVNYFSFTFMVLLHLPEMANYRAVVVYSNPPILPWIASWAKVLFGTKLVFVSYDLYPEVAIITNTLREGSMICRLMEHINHCVYRREDRIVSLSREQRDYILKHRSVAKEDVAVIPNWYPNDSDGSCQRLENRFSDMRKDRFVVSYFGNMGTMQDMKTILDAVRQFQEDDGVLFLFAGHGNKMRALEETVRREKIPNVEILSFLHGQDFQDALDISNCALVCLEKGGTGLCVPSKTYCYMMHGLPLLAIMDPCDIVEDIESGAGLWVKNGESDTLAQNIRYMRDHPEELVKMGQTSRRIYQEKYTKQIGTQKYVALFRDLL